MWYVGTWEAETDAREKEASFIIGLHAYNIFELYL